jgi:hypothetical protein
LEASLISNCGLQRSHPNDGRHLDAKVLHVAEAGCIDA